MKILAITGISFWLVGGAWSQVPWNGSQQKQNPQEQQRAANPPKPIITFEAQNGASKQVQCSEKPSEYPWRELYAPANVPNWILALLAGIAGGLAYKTLRAIKRQVDTYEGKERARLTVEIEPFELPNRDDSAIVTLVVTNHGGTNAFIGKARSAVCLKPRDWDMKDLALGYVPQMKISNAISPGQHKVRERLVADGDCGLGSIPETYDPLRDGTAWIFAVGFIEFEDVFGSSWRLKFSRKWGGIYAEDGVWLFTDDWSESPCYPNGEEKIKKPTRLKF